MIDEDGLTHLLDWMRYRHFGKYRGTVTENADETKRGRLKVKVPAVLGELAVWAMPCVPYAGNQVGLFCLPEPGTGVWVEFEAGDLSFPIWNGFFWADGEVPGSAQAEVKVLATGGFKLTIDDGANSAEAAIKQGATLKLADSFTAEREQAQLVVGTAGVSAEIGANKLELTTAAVSVNNGVLQVV
jgi:hypothetical protein